MVGHRGSTRSEGAREEREHKDTSPSQGFSGSDLWLPPWSCALPQIENRLAVLAQEMTERQNNLTELHKGQ